MHRTQTRDHLFNACPEWKAQQKILSAEVWKESGRGKSRLKIRGLLADWRCSQAIHYLDGLPLLHGCEGWLVGWGWRGE